MLKKAMAMITTRINNFAADCFSRLGMVTKLLMFGILLPCHKTSFNYSSNNGYWDKSKAWYCRL
ncbi:MAG: hypothetical protein A2X82_01080 [Geobacteraceae bacterium GWC2_55_20]|nr:MAG: hypothetical protein A2X82_01080 [Geobacteraceae bacterium GWC2_55_20]